MKLKFLLAPFIFVFFGLVFSISAQDVNAGPGYGWVRAETTSTPACDANTARLIFRLYNTSGAVINGNITVNSTNSGASPFDWGCQNMGTPSNPLVLTVQAAATGYNSLNSTYVFKDDVISNQKNRIVYTNIYLSNSSTSVEINTPSDGGTFTTSNVTFNVSGFKHPSSPATAINSFNVFIGSNVYRFPASGSGNYAFGTGHNIGPVNLGNGSYTAYIEFGDNSSVGYISSKASISFNVNVPSLPTCTITSPAPHYTNTPISFSASGGNGIYSWSTSPDGNISGGGSAVSVIYPTTGSKTVTVTSNGQNAQCNLTVNPQPQPDIVPISFTLSKVNNVQPGETLTAIINVRNSGSSSFSGSWITAVYPDQPGEVQDPGNCSDPGTSIFFHSTGLNAGQTTGQFTIDFQASSVGGPHNPRVFADSSCQIDNEVSETNNDLGGVTYTVVPTVTPTPTPAVSPSPSPPNNTWNTDVACDRFTLNWDPVAGATQYQVRIFGPGFSGVPINNGTSTSITKIGVAASSTYTWDVRAYVGGNWTNWTSGPSVNTPACPSNRDPSNLQVVTGCSGSQASAQFSWDPASDPNLLNPAYTLQVDDEPTFAAPLVFAADTNSTTISISILQPNKTYYWRVRSRIALTAPNWINGPNFTTGNCVVSGNYGITASSCQGGNYFIELTIYSYPSYSINQPILKNASGTTFSHNEGAGFSGPLPTKFAWRGIAVPSGNNWVVEVRKVTGNELDWTSAPIIVPNCRGTITGTKWVTDSPQGPFQSNSAPGYYPPGTNVLVVDNSTGTQVAVDGQPTAAYTFSNLNPGSYTLTATAVSGWEIQACDFSALPCTTYGAGGAARSITVNLAQGEVKDVWFNFRRVFVEQPNLVVDSVVTNKSSYTPGEAMGITITVRNPSGVNVSGTFRVGYSKSGVSTQPACGALSTFYSVSGLNAGQTNVNVINTTAPATGGNYNTGAYVDSGCVISETQEGTQGVTTNGDNFRLSASYSVNAPPANPSSLNVSVSCNSGTNTSIVNFSWIDNATNESQYFLDVTTDPGWTSWGFKTLGANVQNFTWNTTTGQMDGGSPVFPANNTAYYWRVVAQDSSGNPSSHVYYNGGAGTTTPPGITFTTSNCAPPTNPVNLGVSTACVGNNVEVTFTWTPSANHEYYWLDVNTVAWIDDTNPWPWGYKRIDDPAQNINGFIWNQVTTLDPASDTHPSQPGLQTTPQSNTRYWWRLQAVNDTTSLETPHVYPPSNVGNPPGVFFDTPDCRPNLEIAPGSFFVPNGGANSTVTATVQITNTGTSAIAPGTPIELAINSDSPSQTMNCTNVKHGITTYSGGLGIGATSPTININVQLNNQLGTHTAVVMVDSAGNSLPCGDILETDETNNTDWVGYEVVGFDLEVNLNLISPDNQFVPGEQLELSATITNIGGLPFNNFPVTPQPLAWWVLPSSAPTTNIPDCNASPQKFGSGPNGTQAIPNLAVGESTTLAIPPINVGTQDGTFTFISYALPQCAPSGDTGWLNNRDDQNFSVHVDAWFETQDGDAGSQGNVVLAAPPLPRNGQSSELLAGRVLTEVVGRFELSGYDKRLVKGADPSNGAGVGAVYNLLYENSEDKLTGNSFSNTYTDGGTVVDYCRVSNAEISVPNEIVYCPYDARYKFSTDTPPVGTRVIFVDGNLYIEDDLTIPATDSLVFVVAGDITVNTTVVRADGMYISQNDFTDTNGITNGAQLQVLGSVLARNVNLSRKLGGSDCPFVAGGLCDNVATPAELFTYQPRYLVTLASILGNPAIIWREINP